jgi:hypothetical protein
MRRLFGAAIVVICVLVPLVESFDTWDHTLADGNDTEVNVVIAALCVGLVLSTAATVGIASVRSLPIDARFHLTLPSLSFVFRALRGSLPIQTSGPPPTPLRI